MATDNIATMRQLLQRFDFASLFIEELGWDRHNATLPIEIDGQTFTLRSFAEKRGVQILECPPLSDGSIPERSIRQKIEKKVAKAAYEHLIIFVDNAKTRQVWQWVSRRPGQPAAYREHSYHAEHQAGDALIQKLESITFFLSDEEGLTLTGVAFGLRDAFDRDRVTKKFYDIFKKEHRAFLDFIDGITEQGDRDWYASLMLNRLMFIYFIQRKGFLDGDTDYLKNRLQMVREQHGEGKFMTFYRYFLDRLFHEGFGQQPAQRSSDLEQLLGSIPYLNGGLFDVHELEQKYSGIDIPDQAFEKLFAFFDRYEWNLDTRPLRNDREINPDVLGYIFEKYINQKQMGAYYTKEDITEYISKNTVVPYLFDAAKKKCAIAFQAGSALWKLLQEDPDRYIYPAMRKGVIDERGEIIPLPNEIEKGVNDVSQRGIWNTPADPEYALPTEIWREHVTRRQRCLEIREKLAHGEVNEINDLITYNLDIRQFAEDVISSCEGPELLRAFYQAISRVTVLDPTCGSGAFLFAALNILEPLYEACLDRMQAFVEDLERSGEPHRPEKFSDFKRVLAEVDRHPNRRYFILKSIVVNNLYGVDIMEEAVEICKLRLFLKLVAQVDKVGQLEPLPDIDFNIRAGNTLVGFVSVSEIRKAAEYDPAGKAKQMRLLDSKTDNRIRKIEEDAEIVDRAFKKFHEMQTSYDMDAEDFAVAKQELRERLKKLDNELDRYLAREYGIDPDDAGAFAEWQKSHQPFHWFVEFYRIMRRGGFDVIIGNPPYVELSKIFKQYSIRNLSLTNTGNIYSVCLEQFISLTKAKRRTGVIVPISSISTPRMTPLMNFIIESYSPIYISNFAVRPGKLFTGVDMNLTIIVGQKHAQKGQKQIYSTSYNRWKEAFRESLFNQLSFTATVFISSIGSIGKLSSTIELNLLNKALSFRKLEKYRFDGNDSDTIYCHSGGRYFRKGIREKLSNEYKELKLIQGMGNVAICILSSSFYYWLWIVLADCYHVTKNDVNLIPVPNSLIKDPLLGDLAEKFLSDLYENARIIERNRADGSTQREVNFNVGLSKHIIDEIDRALAKHYGFTDEELDFIINYDIKYRMGIK